MAEIPENKWRVTGKRVLIIAAALVALNVALHLVFASLTEKGEVYAVSHRGAAGVAPENTLSAVKAGVSAGAPFIEIDVRLTSDGVPVLMHDDTLDRTTDGAGRVRERSWEYVRNLDAGGRFSDEFKGETVPHLGAVLEYMKGTSSTLVIEVKSPDDYPGVGDVLADYLRKYGMEKRVVVVSFDAGWVEESGRLMPGVALGALYVYPLGVPPSDSVKYVSVFWPAYVLDPSLALRLKRAGYTVWAWNIDNPCIARFLAWQGVDGIVLDRPGILGGAE
ncbi:MAG TPA: glycerophosphodiester phosphodiesterase family protein [Thermodesulfobacteriota bacterium]|nr:glycerophosphodiester phosphodiesterase family protein [Thermodesulfobacteriota bacterium]